MGNESESGTPPPQRVAKKPTAKGVFKEKEFVRMSFNTRRPTSGSGGKRESLVGDVGEPHEEGGKSTRTVSAATILLYACEAAGRRRSRDETATGGSGGGRRKSNAHAPPPAATSSGALFAASSSLQPPQQQQQQQPQPQQQSQQQSVSRADEAYPSVGRSSFGASHQPPTAAATGAQTSSSGRPASSSIFTAMYPPIKRINLNALAPTTAPKVSGGGGGGGGDDDSGGAAA